MKNWMQRFSGLSGLSGLIDLCLESTCPLCQRSTAQAVCLDCQRQLWRLQLPACHQWQPPLPVFAWGSYSGSLKRALTTLKYDNQPQLAQPLGDWLAQSWLQFRQTSKKPSPQSLIVVPIPMHPVKQQQRGFNQAELLAKAFCQSTRLPLNPQVLIRSRSTEAQFGLSVAAREQNLVGAFLLNESVAHVIQRSPQTAVLLLDDIYTSGATARSAAQTLRQQNIAVYGIVTVAKTTTTQNLTKTTVAKT
jgi:ComF family protein